MRRPDRVYVEPRDAWVGWFFGRDALYFIPLPFLVFKWAKPTTSSKQ